MGREKVDEMKKELQFKKITAWITKINNLFLLVNCGFSPEHEEEASALLPKSRRLL